MAVVSNIQSRAFSAILGEDNESPTFFITAILSGEGQTFPDIQDINTHQRRHDFPDAKQWRPTVNPNSEVVVMFSLDKTQLFTLSDTSQAWESRQLASLAAAGWWEPVIWWKVSLTRRTPGCRLIPAELSNPPAAGTENAEPAEGSAEWRNVWALQTWRPISLTKLRLSERKVNGSVCHWWQGNKPTIEDSQ